MKSFFAGDLEGVVETVGGDGIEAGLGASIWCPRGSASSEVCGRLAGRTCAVREVVLDFDFALLRPALRVVHEPSLSLQLFLVRPHQ